MPIRNYFASYIPTNTTFHANLLTKCLIDARVSWFEFILTGQRVDWPHWWFKIKAKGMKLEIWLRIKRSRTGIFIWQNAWRRSRSSPQNKFPAPESREHGAKEKWQTKVISAWVTMLKTFSLEHALEAQVQVQSGNLSHRILCIENAGHDLLARIAQTYENAFTSRLSLSHIIEC